MLCLEIYTHFHILNMILNIKQCYEVQDTDLILLMLNPWLKAFDSFGVYPKGWCLNFLRFFNLNITCILASDLANFLKNENDP